MAGVGEYYGADSESILDLDELVYVNAALAKQANDWLKIGRSLEVSPSSLAIIQANHPAANVGRCLIETLAEWLKNSDLPTWEDVVKAVKKGDPKAAGDIAEKSKDPRSFLTAQVPGVNIEGVDDSLLDDDSDFAAIVSALYDAKVTEQWLEIGLFLGITYGQLQMLRDKSSDEKVHGMVSFWTKWNYEYSVFGKPSWKKLVCAIGARAGGNNRKAAKRIADKHKTDSELPAAAPLAAPDSQTVNWQYETLSRNSAQIIQALANNRLAERLADLLKARGVIGDAVYANATNYGPNVTEYSRVKHLITAVQTSTRAMPQRYHDFIEVLQSDSIRPDAEAALVYLPTSAPASV